MSLIGNLATDRRTRNSIARLLNRIPGLFLLPAALPATMISLVVGEQTITIAADAARGEVISDVHSTASICKIRTIGNLLFLTSGRTADQNIKTANSTYDI